MARVFARFLAVVSKSVRTYDFVSSWNEVETEFIQSPLGGSFNNNTLVEFEFKNPSSTCKVYSLFDLIKGIFCVTIGENDSDHGSVYESNSSFQQKG